MVDFIALIFGSNENTLSQDEVHALVGSYKPEDVTDELLEFGKLLVAANRERTAQLEGKATAIAGYAGVFLALLLSREPIQSVMVGNWPPGFVRAASVFAGLALVCVFGALAVRRHPWLSDRQWFEDDDDVLENADKVKRCHVLALHSINGHMRASNDRKADFVIAGQACLLIAGICAAVWLVLR